MIFIFPLVKEKPIRYKSRLSVAGIMQLVEDRSIRMIVVGARLTLADTTREVLCFLISSQRIPQWCSCWGCRLLRSSRYRIHLIKDRYRRFKYRQSIGSRESSSSTLPHQTSLLSMPIDMIPKYWEPPWRWSGWRYYGRYGR